MTCLACEEHALQPVSLGYSFDVTVCEKSISRLRENRAALRGALDLRFAESEQQQGPVRVVMRPQFERRGVPAICTLEVVQTESPVSSGAQRQPGREGQAASRLS